MQFGIKPHRRTRHFANHEPWRGKHGSEAVRRKISLCARFRFARVPMAFRHKGDSPRPLGLRGGGTFLENDIFYRNLHYYQYPEECMRILALNPAAGKKGNHFAPVYDYTVERISDGTKAIVTSCPQAVLTCTSYSEDPSIWDSLFTDAFAWQLAGELCLSFGGALDTVRTLREIADRAFEKAKSRDCGEEAADIYCSKYLEARK